MWKYRSIKQAINRSFKMATRSPRGQWVNAFNITWNNGIMGGVKSTRHVYDVLLGIYPFSYPVIAIVSIYLIRSGEVVVTLPGHSWIHGGNVNAESLNISKKHIHIYISRWRPAPRQKHWWIGILYQPIESYASYSKLHDKGCTI